MLLCEEDDLSHLPCESLTLENVLARLSARYYQGVPSIWVGPVLVYTRHDTPPSIQHLDKIISSALENIFCTGHKQTIVISGVSGAGKGVTTMMVLRRLFNMLGTTQTTDFQHLCAAVTVIDALGTAGTAYTNQSARIGKYFEIPVCISQIRKPKVQCFFLPERRVAQPSNGETNYQIFYTMLAGLDMEERQRFGLAGKHVGDFKSLTHNNKMMDDEELKMKFTDWKKSLASLGISYQDVMQILVGCLHLANLEFLFEEESIKISNSEDDLDNLCEQLGLSPSSLVDCLTKRSALFGGETVCCPVNIKQAELNISRLCMALYSRTVSTIVKKINSAKLRNMEETEGKQTSDMTGGSFIGVCNMWGFEDTKPSQLEQLCINLTVETLQHFYHTFTFKTCTSGEYYRSPCEEVIQVVTNQHTGIFSLLSLATLSGGEVVEAILSYHQDTQVVAGWNMSGCSDIFTILHHAGPVLYHAAQFSELNRDSITGDLLNLFRRENCRFRFATHLFTSELSALQAKNFSAETEFGISPSSAALRTTYTQEFCTRLDGLLKTLVLSQPQFIMCLAPNFRGLEQEFNMSLVTQQLKSLEIMETLQILSTGFSYRMKLSEFRAKYSCLLMMCVDLVVSVTNLCSTLHTMYGSTRLASMSGTSVLLSEQGRQLLDRLRAGKRSRAARSIQGWWRGRSRRTETGQLAGVDVDMLKLTCQFLGKDWVRNRYLSINGGTVFLCVLYASY